MVDHTRGTRCTIQRHGGDFCDAPSAEDMPFPICGRHAAKLYRHIAHTMTGLASDPLLMLHTAVKEIDEARIKQSRRKDYGRPTVYYVQVGETIKIGFTIALQRRLAHYPPNRRLLATEPGDYSLESKRHEQFADLRAYGNEWFHPGPKLIAHINTLRKAAGAAPIELPQEIKQDL